MKRLTILCTAVLALGAAVASATITTTSNVYDSTIWFNEDFASAVDSAGNLYTVGYAFLAPPQSDYVTSIRKYGTKGSSSWTQTRNVSCQSCPGNETATDIALSSGGSSVYVSSYAPELVGVNTGADWRITKYNSAGVLQWEQVFGTSNDDRPFGIDYDDQTDTIVIVGSWGTAAQVMRLQGATGATLGTDTTTLTAAFDVSVDPTASGMGGPGAGFYVVGGSAFSTFGMSGTYLGSQSITFDGTHPPFVDVDLGTGAVCLGGSGSNLASGSSGLDGWARRYAYTGALDWSVSYHNSTELFLGIAAKHGGNGCVAVGEVGSGNTDMLLVDYSGAGNFVDDDIADDSSRPNPGYHVVVQHGGTAKVVATGRAWSVFGGPPPQPFSYDGWIRWLTL